MVPADRAGPSTPDRSTDPDGSRGNPLSEPTMRAGELDEFTGTPVLDDTAPE
jgi:hypothetical protein